MPVIGFNSGKYDLQLIRKYLITHLGEENVSSGEKQGRIMFMNTPQFQFLDVTPMTNGSRHMGQSKLSLGFHTNGLTAQTNLTTRGSLHWYSQLKNSYVLTPTEYDECKLEDGIHTKPIEFHTAN